MYTYCDRLLISSDRTQSARLIGVVVLILCYRSWTGLALAYRLTYSLIIIIDGILASVYVRASCRENMPSHFKVKEYCPLVFRNLRERFNVDDVDYRESLTRSQPLCIDSPGKSGAQFYQSYDKLYILKSLTSEEVERMHSFLKHYHPVSKHCP